MQTRATARRPISIRRPCGWLIGALASTPHRLSSWPDPPRSRRPLPPPRSRSANGPASMTAIGSLPARRLARRPPKKSARRCSPMRCLVYPTPGLLVEPPATLAAWLEAENISVACLAAATWNRLAAAIAARKVRKPAKLRLVLVTEGEPGEGSFGRVVRDDGKNGGVWVSRRTVLESGGGTIALDTRLLPLTTRRLHILDRRSRQPLPIGVIGELVVSEGAGIETSTGQLARWLPDGSLDRLGFPNEQSYARGFRLDPRRVEKALCAVPGIRHALVRPATAAPGTRFIAYVLPDLAGGPLPSDDALRQSLQRSRSAASGGARPLRRDQRYPVDVERASRSHGASFASAG